MDPLFEKLTPQQLTAVICTVAGVVAFAVLVLAVLHYQLRALADQTALEQSRQQSEAALRKEWQQSEIALKQELVRRNLPPAELALALEAIGAGSGPPGSEEDEEEEAEEYDEEVTAQVVKNLVYCSEEVPTETVEETMAIVAAADPSVQRTLADVLDDLVENGYSGETIFATVRSLCKALAGEEDEEEGDEEEDDEEEEEPNIDLRLEQSIKNN